MWKPAASLLALALVGGPVTVALAEDEAQVPTSPSTEERNRLALELETERLAVRGEESRHTDRPRRAARSERRERRGVDVPPALEAIAACESGGNPRAIGGGGTYGGKYQFSRETWASVGGEGDPADAPEAEQDRRAAILYARSGASSWPVCGGG